GDPFPDFIDPALTTGIEVVGSIQTPNLEKIAALNPDLIIGTQLVVAPLQDELDTIAPTVATHYAFYVSNWRDDVLLAADAGGVLDQVRAKLSEFDARVETLHAELTADGDGPTLSRVDVFSGSLVYYRYACSAFGEVLLSVGIRQPEAQAGDCTDNDYTSVLQYPSLEQVDVFDADVIVAYQHQAGSTDVGANPLDVISTSPLWGNLAA
ncbi:MAG TPA: ABC transporter substrate-binding protein, partial [Ilumatobacteraceae bacterium]|nr:ABC transporter substrate-binding protein [Ilumatobacteraceae bacterium]